MKHFFKQLVLLLVLAHLTACGEEKKEQLTKSELQSYTVTAKPLHKVLHFTGTVQPIHENSIVSPMEAVVDAMSFHYGQPVKKGEVVFFSWVTYKSRKHRDQVMKKVMSDKRLEQFMNEETMPFDGMRMFWGGFKPLVQF